jgi:S-adenosylmethionine:tRNA ribosyltransferase-isomerase
MPKNTLISTGDYLYRLPESSIARYPLPLREQSRLLLYDGGSISHHGFTELPELLPLGGWLVFNNTKVIQARLAFKKPTGALIEVFCLVPVAPADYQQSFQSLYGCTWKCLVGNARKWKSGPVFLDTTVSGQKVNLSATVVKQDGEGFEVRFQWNPGNLPFGSIIESAGSTPIPPYLNRNAEESDKIRYQTVYCLDPGSVAAPTAGLHFTERMMRKLKQKGIRSGELTLHVGAGTFVPIKQQDAREHRMHSETVIVSRRFLENWATRSSGLIAVGTTSTRSLETLYWLGVKLFSGHDLDPFNAGFRQWENEFLPGDVSLDDSLSSLLEYFKRNHLEQLEFTTGLMIVPGYTFRTISGLITNFHLPGSTLLLLIAALIGDDWKRVYDAALKNNYRFLSYGDTSLLLP